MNSEFTNFFRSVGVMIMLMVLVTLGLYRIAYITGAGNAAFYQSLLFAFGQAVVQILFYGLWYRKVNRLAADMYDTTEKRSMAFRYKNRYLLLAVVVTGLIAGIAISAMLVHVIFVGISFTYCSSSVWTMFFVGNVALFVLMRFCGLPNRVTNTY